MASIRTQGEFILEMISRINIMIESLNQLSGIVEEHRVKINEMIDKIQTIEGKLNDINQPSP